MRESTTIRAVSQSEAILSEPSKVVESSTSVPTIFVTEDMTAEENYDFVNVESCDNTAVLTSSKSSTHGPSDKDTRKFRHEFPSLASECLLSVYRCALEKDVIWQGKCYLTSNHCCFYGKIFAKAAKVALLYAEIISIEKKHTAGIIPNAIRIKTASNRYTLCSFLRRDAAFSDIMDSWKTHRRDSVAPFSLSDDRLLGSERESRVSRSMKPPAPRIHSDVFHDDDTNTDSVVITALLSSSDHARHSDTDESRGPSPIHIKFSASEGLEKIPEVPTPAPSLPSASLLKSGSDPSAVPPAFIPVDSNHYTAFSTKTQNRSDSIVTGESVTVNAVSTAQPAIPAILPKQPTTSMTVQNPGSPPRSNTEIPPPKISAPTPAQAVLDILGVATAPKADIIQPSNSGTSPEPASMEFLHHSLGRNLSSKSLAVQYSGTLVNNMNDFFRRLIPNTNENATGLNSPGGDPNSKTSNETLAVAPVAATSPPVQKTKSLSIESAPSTDKISPAVTQLQKVYDRLGSNNATNSAAAGGNNNIARTSEMVIMKRAGNERTRTQPVHCGCDTHPNHVIILDEVVDMDVKTLFNTLYGENATLVKEVHSKRDVLDYTAGDWVAGDEKSQSRDISYNAVPRNPLGLTAKTYTPCNERQTILKQEHGSTYVVQSLLRTPKIPYGDAFYIEQRVCLHLASAGKSRIKVCVKVEFRKSTVFKDKIEQASIESTTSFLKDLVAAVRERSLSISRTSPVQAHQAAAAPSRPAHLRHRRGPSSHSSSPAHHRKTKSGNWQVKNDGSLVDSEKSKPPAPSHLKGDLPPESAATAIMATNEAGQSLQAIFCGLLITLPTTLCDVLWRLLMTLYSSISGRANGASLCRSASGTIQSSSISSSGGGGGSTDSPRLAQHRHESSMDSTANSRHNPTRNTNIRRDAANFTSKLFVAGLIGGTILTVFNMYTIIQVTNRLDTTIQAVVSRGSGAAHIIEPGIPDSPSPKSPVQPGQEKRRVFELDEAYKRAVQHTRKQMDIVATEKLAQLETQQVTLQDTLERVRLDVRDALSILDQHTQVTTPKTDLVVNDLVT
ncbi:hypothetical protein SeMB42_g07526 [Synchytrium endobioticum]|uniref:VASt domain-containing protein n=1 Tax=Synchytrium endobioticum TaxID=286115 RepID=A0A507CSR0_9FUNG|nr:hypothetical protein SeMB42_g07526 [Synchytrium endobioticum]TPX42204.1 hypothetical protein SeLEV6574_g05713 [Synchytrium endobioticum]